MQLPSLVGFYRFQSLDWWSVSNFCWVSSMIIHYYLWLSIIIHCYPSPMIQFVCVVQKLISLPIRMFCWVTTSKFTPKFRTPHPSEGCVWKCCVYQPMANWLPFFMEEMRFLSHQILGVKSSFPRDFQVWNQSHQFSPPKYSAIVSSCAGMIFSSKTNFLRSPPDIQVPGFRMAHRLGLGLYDL